MIISSAASLTGAWIQGVERLMAAGGDTFTAILHVERPAEPVREECDARAILDDFLPRHGMQDTQAVANTVFPSAIARGRTADELYSRYQKRTFPRLRRLRPNAHGTYFYRLIHLEVVTSSGVVVRNPLRECIAKIETELGRRGTLRSAYELSIYRAELDAGVRMGFPCLSHLSLKLDSTTKQLHLTAVYRNQRYVERAYGNLLGLARLQAFIAQEVGLGVGELVCHATHAEIDPGVGRRALESLITRMRTTFPDTSLDRVAQTLTVKAG